MRRGHRWLAEGDRISTPQQHVGASSLPLGNSVNLWLFEKSRLCPTLWPRVILQAARATEAKAPE